MTSHHARYYAHDLTRNAPAGMERLSMALFDAAVNLNPTRSMRYWQSRGVDDSLHKLMIGL